MSAARKHDMQGEGWRRRQERMRFELLLMLYHACHAEPARRVNAWRFAASLGVWEEEVWDGFLWLEQGGFVRVYDAGPVVSLTLAGQRYIEHEAMRRKTVRGVSPPENSTD